MLHGFDFVEPRVLEFQLHPLDWHQESEELIVLFNRVLAEEQMKRPFDVVVERETAPGILLVGLIRTRECPVLQEQPIVKVRGLMSEAKECRTIVHADKISQLKLHLNDRFSNDYILVSSILQINIHK